MKYAGDSGLSESETRQKPHIKKAARVLRAGGVVAIPTDTVYGLAARAFDLKAIARVFEIKGRDFSAALPLLLANVEMMDQCMAGNPEIAIRLAKTFWPGPLTIVVLKSDRVPSELTGGGPTVGLRVPDHHVPRALSAALNEPITGTSANLTGEPAFTDYDNLKLEMDSDLDYILDGGALPDRPASTVIDATGEIPRILRQGGVAQDAIESALGIEILPPMV